MNTLTRLSLCCLGSLLLLPACQPVSESNTTPMSFSGAPGEVRLMILDPGHFHAGLVQKSMYEQVDSTVHVFAPEGPDVAGYLQQVEAYNQREDDPTRWELEVYTGPDYLERMLAETPGNVMVTAGNNRRKTEYIYKTIDAGIHVLADKPMAIDPEGFTLLEQCFARADSQQLLLYDIMTERYEITTMMQKRFSRMPEIFGELQRGSLEEPAVTKESVHHFFKYVSGNEIKRPAWFFDITQQGEGIVDVTTHLVDLVQWECFPEQVIDYRSDIELLNARRWATRLSPEQFQRVTRLDRYPAYLQPYVDAEGMLDVYANGEINYTIKGVHARVKVIWNYEAPPGSGDTHYSIMRGTRARLIIRQGEAEGFVPQLYIEPQTGVDRAAFEQQLQEQVAGLQDEYPGLALEASAAGWRLVIPDAFRVGHEAHFGQVTEKYLQYLAAGKLPDWEVPNMLAKYYLTTRALALAKE